MRKFISFLAILLFLTTISPYACLAADNEYVTLADIREEVQDGWHQTYDVNGTIVVVDVPIEIPDVSQVAIVKVKYPDETQPIDLPDNANYHPDENGIGYYVQSKPDTIFGSQSGSGGTNERYLAKGAQAENNPLSPDEACAFALELLVPYAEKYDVDLELYYTDAHSRLYKTKSADRDGITANYEKPLTEMGTYGFEFKQVFHGIPYMYDYAPFYYSSQPKVNRCRPWGRVHVSVGTTNDYSFSFHPAIEDRVLEEDVPLAPFSQVKKEFESLIMDGYIKEVFKVRLVYVRMDNPDDIENSAILIPVWEVNCTIVQSPSHSPTLPTFTGERLEWIKEVGGAQEALVNAQTAIYYDPMDTSKTRNHAKYIRWDDVQ